MPQWKQGPYSFEHVEYFADLPGLEGGTFEISDEGRTDKWLGQAQTVEQARLFAAAPDLYEALEALLTEMGTVRYCNEPPLDEFEQQVSTARKALAKARGEV